MTREPETLGQGVCRIPGGDVDDRQSGPLLQPRKEKRHALPAMAEPHHAEAEIGPVE
jgi:hypothetical protein